MISEAIFAQHPPLISLGVLGRNRSWSPQARPPDPASDRASPEGRSASLLQVSPAGSAVSGLQARGSVRSSCHPCFLRKGRNARCCAAALAASVACCWLARATVSWSCPTCSPWPPRPSRWLASSRRAACRARPVPCLSYSWEPGRMPTAGRRRNSTPGLCSLKNCDCTTALETEASWASQPISNMDKETGPQIQH